MSRNRGRSRYAERQRARDKKPPGADRRPRQTDTEREAGEAAFADLLARQRGTRNEDTES